MDWNFRQSTPWTSPFGIAERFFLERPAPSSRSAGITALACRTLCNVASTAPGLEARALLRAVGLAPRTRWRGSSRPVHRAGRGGGG